MTTKINMITNMFSKGNSIWGRSATILLPNLDTMTKFIMSHSIQHQVTTHLDLLFVALQEDDLVFFFCIYADTRKGSEQGGMNLEHIRREEKWPTCRQPSLPSRAASRHWPSVPATQTPTGTNHNSQFIHTTVYVHTVLQSWSDKTDKKQCTSPNTV